jgi:hypothetical protein
VLRQARIWAVIAADAAQLPPARREAFARAGIRVLGETEFREQRLNRLDLSRLSPDWTQRAAGLGERRLERALRRGFDIAASLGLLLATLPVTLLTALAIRLDPLAPSSTARSASAWTAGLHPGQVPQHGGRCRGGGKPALGQQAGFRITRVGRVLRLFRIDEIPGDQRAEGRHGDDRPKAERPAFVDQLVQQIPALCRPPSRSPWDHGLGAGKLSLWCLGR